MLHAVQSMKLLTGLLLNAIGLSLILPKKYHPRSRFFNTTTLIPVFVRSSY